MQPLQMHNGKDIMISLDRNALEGEREDKSEHPIVFLS